MKSLEMEPSHGPMSNCILNPPYPLRDSTMNAKLRELPVEDRIKLVEDLWDSIAADQKALPVTAEQKAELDRRLDAYELDQNSGRLASDVVADVRRRL